MYIIVSEPTSLVMPGKVMHTLRTVWECDCMHKLACMFQAFKR